VFGFASRPLLDEWLESDARRSVLAGIDELLEGGRTVNVVGGFGGWFGTEGSAPVKRWKQAAVVLLALFPTALVLTLLRRELLPDLALVPSVALSNIVGVAILSWVLMPVLTQLLSGWLRH
jgi:antibiotic biosynthesis monooxygenase (ABM) superfamily enzyme